MPQVNKGRHLYSARRPSRWALAHISSSSNIFQAKLSHSLMMHIAWTRTPSNVMFTLYLDNSFDGHVLRFTWVN